MTCKDCEHARWELAKNGRINANHSGRCAVPLSLVLPMCVDERTFFIHRSGIWVGTAHQCPLWKKIEGKPKSKGES